MQLTPVAGEWESSAAIAQWRCDGFVTVQPCTNQPLTVTAGRLLASLLPRVLMKPSTRFSQMTCLRMMLLGELCVTAGH